MSAPSCHRLPASAHTSYHALPPRGQLKGQAGPGFPSESWNIGEGPPPLSTLPLPSALQTQSSREGWDCVYLQALPLVYPDLFSPSGLGPGGQPSSAMIYHMTLNREAALSEPQCPHPLNKGLEALRFSTYCSRYLANSPSTSWLANSCIFLDSTHVIGARRSCPSFHLLPPIPSWIAPSMIILITLLSSYHMPGAVLNMPHILIYLVLAIPPGGYY